MINVNKSLKDLSEDLKNIVKEELKAMFFPTIPEEFVDDIVKTLFTKFGFHQGNSIKRHYPFTNVSGAQSMVRYFEGNNDKLKEKFGITISDVTYNEITVELCINY